METLRTSLLKDILSNLFQDGIGVSSLIVATILIAICLVGIVHWLVQAVVDQLVR